MLDQRDRTVYRRAFFVSGNDQADPPCVFGGNSGNKGSDTRLHVDGAAAVQQVSADLGHEGVGRPARPWRNDVEMPRKGEMAAATSAVSRREKIFDWAVRGFARQEPVHFEAQHVQGRLQYVEDRARGRSHARDRDQVLGQPDCIDHWPRLA